jgi:TetR/AcrR family transcriptional repressor of nem operon
MINQIFLTYIVLYAWDNFIFAPDHSVIIYICQNLNEMTKADRTRQLIIDKAAPIFNTKGIDATAMSDIMAATNLSKGTLYIHFENKEDLAFCVVNHNLQTFLASANNAMIYDSGYKNQLISLIDFFADPLNPPVEGGCPILNFGVEADDINPVIRNEVNKTILCFLEIISLIVHQGVENGEFISDWDGKVFAMKTFSMLEGAQMISRVAQSNDPMSLIIKLIKEEIEKNCL